MAPEDPLVRHCQALVRRLLSPHFLAPPSPPHANEKGTSLADHLLTTSAIVACLAHGHPACHLLRLAALTHDLSPDDPLREWGAEAEAVRRWVELLQAHGRLLDDAQWPDLSALDQESRWLALAHLVASQHRAITTADDFTTHPLRGDEGVDLVYGGATKIKEYVSESARLPEIRGASALLDHINRLDLPALWGCPPEPSGEPRVNDAQKARYRKSREWFQAPEKGWGAPLDAPECVLYASGGNLLALAPAGRGAAFAEAIERRYTEETDTANSVAVSQSFSLLELQYGVKPEEAWFFNPAVPQSSEAAALVKQSGGLVRTEDRKGFGELVTVLANRANQRRAGDGRGTGTHRFVPFWQLTSTARKCNSCDMRPATAEIPILSPDEPQELHYFCTPCQRKHDAGRWAKKVKMDKQRTPGYEWLRPWGTWLEEQAAAMGYMVQIEETATDLEDIADPSLRFVGLIYADGNDVGSAIAELASPSRYRRFAQTMLHANETAVAKGMLTYLGPVMRQARTIWPFEVLTIGGDDVMLLVPATQALDVAAEIAREFQNQMEKTEKLSLSVGVLLLPTHTPVRFAIDLVEQLLKEAKEKAADRQREEESLKKTQKEAGERPSDKPVEPIIDFMALKQVSLVTETLKRYKQVASKRQSGDKADRRQFILTQCPYTLSELDLLIKACRALKEANFPRSQLYQLRHHLEGASLLRSAVDYGYFVTRGKQHAARRWAFDTFDAHLADLCKGRRWLPWRTPERAEGSEAEADPSDKPSIYDTPLLDIIELYPFIRSNTGEGGAS